MSGLYAEIRSWRGYGVLLAVNASVLAGVLLRPDSRPLDAALMLSGLLSALAVLQRKARGATKSDRRRLGNSVIKAYLITVVVGAALISLAYQAGL